MLTRQEADKIMKMKGESRGVLFQSNCDFLSREKGEEKRKRLERRMEELGYPLKCKDIRAMDFYPFGLYVLSWLIIKEMFDEEEFKNWGYSTVKFSLFIKIFMKFFGSYRMLAREVPKMWKKHYTVGELEIADYSKEKKYIIIRLKDFKIDPTWCGATGGYFAKIAELVVKAPVKYKETKCIFRGDPYHEYRLTW